MGQEFETQESIRLAERFKRHAQTMDDFHNEMAGRDVGRISRFIGASASSSVEGQKRRNERYADNASLQIMMANAAYQALVHQTIETLQDAQSRITTVLDRIHILRSEAEQARDDAVSRAARLPDGAPVFRDRDGNVRRVDGALVSAELAATILWRGNEPSFEDWQFHQDRLERLDALETEALDGQQAIGEMQTRVEDNEADATPEDMEGMQEDAEGIVSGLEQSLEVEAARTPPSVSRETATQTVGLTIPILD